MKAIILAGGFGSRLRQRVSDLPKPMAPVAGRPFLEYLLAQLSRAGCEEVTLSLGYLWQIIRDHFGTSWQGLAIRYAVEETPLGTGGAILHALPPDASEPLLVVNGDTFLDLDFRLLIDWQRESAASLGMVLRHVEDASRYGSVLVADDIVSGFAEKGRQGAGLINAGVYVLQPDVFSNFGLSGKFSLETDLLQRHCEQLRPRAFVTDAYFIDIGIPADYDRAQAEMPRFFENAGAPAGGASSLNHA